MWRWRIGRITVYHIPLQWAYEKWMVEVCVDNFSVLYFVSPSHELVEWKTITSGSKIGERTENVRKTKKKRVFHSFAMSSEITTTTTTTTILTIIIVVMCRLTQLIFLCLSVPQIYWHRGKKNFASDSMSSLGYVSISRVVLSLLNTAYR